MNFSAQDVAKLREMTGAGMMDCKKALTEANGNMDEAVNYLRQKGIASAAKKAGNVAAEGVIAARLSEDKKSGLIIEVNAQTDFVAKNDDFKNFVNQVSKLALDKKCKDLDTLLKEKIDSHSVEEAAKLLTAKIGEKIEIRRINFLETQGLLAAYVHPVGSKIGVLVAISDADNNKAADLAMHIAASNPAPEFITKNQIPESIIQKEKEIEAGKEDLKGKPAEIIDKIVSGRVDKLLATKVLSEQAFVKDPNQKISQYLANTEVETFVRYNLGEGIEKKQANFADEVAAMMGA